MNKLTAIATTLIITSTINVSDVEASGAGYKWNRTYHPDVPTVTIDPRVGYKMHSIRYHSIRRTGNTSSTSTAYRWGQATRIPRTISNQGGGRGTANPKKKVIE